MAEEQEKKLFLLDAYALIFRAYYAFIKNPMLNSGGLNTSAIFGFTSALEELLTKEKPTHLAIVFDPPGGSFRRELFPAYKANRLETPEDIKKSVPFIKKIAAAYHIPVLEVEKFEADDVIGTLARQAEKKGFTTFMMTPDKDFAQLVTENIRMYKPSRGGNGPEIWGIEEVKKRFGIDNPSKVIDILALMGDASDNIPGAPGIGEKTSQKLISGYGNLKLLYENLDQLPEKQKNILKEYREQVELSYLLATIRDDVPIAFEEENLRLGIPDKEELKQVFAELEFKNMINRVLGRLKEGQPESPPRQSTLFGNDEMSARQLERLQTINHRYEAVEGEEALKKLASMLEQQKEFCFDTETTSLDVHEAELVGISFCWEAFKAYYVPLPAGYDRATEILRILKNPFAEKTIGKIGQNCKFDLEMLHKYGVAVNGEIFDTMIAHYLLHPEGRHNLNHLAETYLNYSPVTIESLIGEKGKEQASMRDVPREKITEYACEDADIAFRLKQLLEKELEKPGMTELAKKVEMPLIRVLVDMEMYGMKVREDVLNEYSGVLSTEIESLENKIHRLAGEDFNISSPKQLGEILFEKLKISDKPGRTPTGQYSTNEEVLMRLTDSHEIVPLILEHRTLKKLLSTYVETLPMLIKKHSGKIHTSFNQTVTATGRLSSNQPNLQNIPIREERGREIRKAFVPSDKEYILLSADYSQIELRLMAHMSKDPAMINAFIRSEDIHTATAARVFKIDPAQVTREMRGKAKTANFGIIYGISAFGLSQRLNIDRSKARALIDGYFESYPGVKRYMDNCIRQARDNGYAKTIMGRRRNLPDIHSRNAVVRGMAERNAINSPIQGSAADIIKLAMVAVHETLNKRGLRSAMILQVHDELIFDVYRPELEELKNIVKKEMQEVILLDVPLVVEMGTGENWLEAH